MNLPPFDLGLPALFVTGTDTDVGKTIVVGALAAAAHQCGVRVGVMKPVESGCPSRDGRLVPRDAIFTRELAGGPPRSSRQYVGAVVVRCDGR